MEESMRANGGRALALIVGAGICAAGCSAPASESATAQPTAQGGEGRGIPYFEYDPTWPKLPLPNNWITGNIAGVHVDEKDQIWVLQRGNTVPLDLGDDYAAMDPPAGDCCKPAPSVMVFDLAGNVVKAWGG